MNRSIRVSHKWFVITSLAAASVLTSVAWAGTTDQTVTIRAGERAAHYSELEAYYRSLAKPGSKQQIIYFTAANRAYHLAQHYRRLAAAEEQHPQG